MKPALSSQTLMCIGPSLIAFSRPPIICLGARIDCRIDCPVDSVTKERFARAARTAGFSTSAAYLRSLIEEKASTVPMVRVIDPSLMGRNQK